jgi:hypothetical protein
MDVFKHWLDAGLNGSEPELAFEVRDLVQFFTRFNLQIETIREDWNDSQLAKGIWHLYGSGSCYLSEISQLPPCRELDDFFNSVPLLYTNLFEVRCSSFFSHLDRGPEPANPLNGPCYMLWDMDCGIDSFRFTGVREHVDHSLRLLQRLSASTHPATVESAIHGLGHMIDDFRDRCQPSLERIISRTEVPLELRNYALNAINYYIQ